MMMRRVVRRVLPVAVLSSMIVACGTSSGAFTPQDDAAIRAASAEYARLETAGDPEKWAAISATDAIMMPDGEKPIQGRAALVAWAKRAPAGVKLTMTVQEITGHGDTAIERGSFDVSNPAAPGGPPDEGSYLVVWERQPGGGWLITQNIWNSDRP